MRGHILKLIGIRNKHGPRFNGAYGQIPEQGKNSDRAGSTLIVKLDFQSPRLTCIPDPDESRDGSIITRDAGGVC